MTKGKAGPEDVKIGARLKEIREELGLSQMEMGSLFEPPISMQQVSKIERGLNRVSAGNIKALAEALALNVGLFYED